MGKLGRLHQTRPIRLGNSTLKRGHLVGTITGDEILNLAFEDVVPIGPLRLFVNTNAASLGPLGTLSALIMFTASWVFLLQPEMIDWSRLINVLLRRRIVASLKVQI